MVGLKIWRKTNCVLEDCLMTLEKDSAINVQRDETEMEPQAVQDSASSGPLSVRTDNCSIGNDKVKMEVTKKFRCLLNKLTLEKYELILGHIMALPMDTDEILESLADILFNKAVAEPHFASMYARLFSRMNRMLSENLSTTFHKFLLKKCQDEFFKIAINLEVTNEASISREESLKCEQEEENSGRKLTGLCRFIVELFRRKIIAPKILHSCINHLLEVGTEEALLGLSEFFVTAGRQLENEFAQEMLDWFRALQVAVKSTTSSKCRLILLNLLDLRQRHWVTLGAQHKAEMQPKTLDIVKRKVIEGHVRQLWLTRVADLSSNKPIIREPMNSDHEMPESELLRSMKGILNRLSFQNVDRLADKFKGLPLNSFHRLNLAARMIISTAVYNPMQCQLFVELCAHLQNLAVLVNTNDPCDEKIANSLDSPTIVTFKDLLFGLTSNRNSQNCLRRARLKPWTTITEMMNCSEDVKQINNFISYKTNTLKVFSIGLSRFIGELYKRGILSPLSTLNHITRLLIPGASENHLQCAYTILLTAGQDLEDYSPKMNDYFKKIREFIENKKQLSFGTKHLLKELVELRGRNWEHLREIDLPQEFVLMQKATEVENLLNSIELHSKRAIIDKAWNECPQKSSLGLNSDSELRRPNRSNKQRSSECNPDESKITKTLNRLLNNLTPQNFERYASQIRELPFESEEDLMEIVYNIFERAVDDSLYLPLYADLCHCLQKLMIVIVTEGAVSFRKILLNKCQDEFENIASNEQNTESGIDVSPHSENDNGNSEDKRTKEEFKRKSVGLMRFIGELYNRAMLTPGIIRKCAAALLSQVGEVSIECACKLLTSAGKQLERELSKEEFEEIMTRIYELTTNTHDPPVSLRIKFMLQELLELRRNGWISQHMGNQYRVEPILCQAEPSQYSNWRQTSENKFQSDILYSNNSELQHLKSSSEEGAHSEVAPPLEVAVPTSVPNEETLGQLKLSPTWCSVKPNKMGTSESRMEPIVSENVLEEESSTGDVNYTKQQGYADVSRIKKGVISDHDDPATPLECKTCDGSEKDSTSTDTVKQNESDGIVESTNLSLQDTSDSLRNCKTIVETNEMKGVIIDGLENNLGSPSPISSATGDSPIPCSPSRVEQVEESMMRAMILKYFTEPLSSSDNSLPAYYVSEEKYGKLWLECPEASDMDSCEHKRSCSKFSQLRASNFVQLGESLIGYPASSWFEKNTLGSPVHSEKSIDPENNETKPMRVQIWITEKSHPTAYDVKNDIFLKMCVVEEINRSDLVPPHRAYLTTDGNIEFSLNVGNQKEGIADFIDEFQRTQNFGLDRKQYSPSWESVIDALTRIPLYVTSEQAMSHSKSKTRNRKGKRGSRKHKKSASKEGSNNDKTDFNDESIVQTDLQSEFTLENDTLGVPVSTGVGIDCLNHGGSIVELVRSVDFYKAFSELSNNDEPSKMNDLGNDGVGSPKTVVSDDASIAAMGSGFNDELVDSSNLIQDESNNGMDEMSDIGLDGACHALDQIHLTESPEELMMRNGIQDFIDERNTETMNHTTDEAEKSLQNRASSATPVGFTETCVDQEPMSEVDWMGVTIGIEKILADETGGSDTDDSEMGSNLEVSDKKGVSGELVDHIKEDLLDDESEDVKHSDNHSSESDEETSGSSTETESQDEVTNSESLTTDVTSPRALSEITDKESTSNMGISSKSNEDVMRFEKIELSSSLNSLRDIGLKVVHPRGVNIVSHLYKIPDAHWLAGTGIEPVSTPIKLIKSSSQNVSSSLLKALERTCSKVDNTTSSTSGKVASTSSYKPTPNTINTIKSPSQDEPSTTLKVLEKTCSKVGNATNSTSEKVASTSSCEPKSTTINMIKSSSQDVSSTLLKALEKTSLAKNSISGQDCVQTKSSYVPPWKRAQFSSIDIKQTCDKSEDSSIRKTKLEMIAEKLTPTETGEAHSKSEKGREDINSSDKVENEGSPFKLKSLPSHFGQPPSNNMSQGFARHALSDPSTSRSDLLRTIESQPAVDSITQEPRMVSSMLGATSSRAPVPPRFTSSVVPAPPMGAIPVRTPLQMKPALLQGVKMAKVCHYSNRPDEFGQLVGDCITTMSTEQRTHAINIIWDVLTEGNYHTLCEYSRLSGVMNGQESGKEGPSQQTNNPQPFINYGFPPSLPATKFPFPRSNDPTTYSFQGEQNPVTMSSDLTHKIQNPQPATHKTQASGPKQSLVGHNVASNQKSVPPVGKKCPPSLNQEALSKKAGLGVKTSQPKIKSKQKSPINPNPSSSKQGTNTTKKTLAKNVVQKPQGAVKLSVKSQNESHPNPNEPTNWRDPARPFLSYVINRSEITLIPKTENLATGSQNPVSTSEKVTPKTKANEKKSPITEKPIPASEGSSKKKKKKIRLRNSAKTKPTSNS